MVFCAEGIYRIGDVLSEKFGCRWELSDIIYEPVDVDMMDRGQHLLKEEKRIKFHER